MQKQSSTFGFDHFQWTRPGESNIQGREYDNDWFVGRSREGEKISSSDEIERRTGIQSRYLADCSETVLSMAEKAVRQFFDSQRVYTRQKCARIFLLTSAVDREVLGSPQSSKKPGFLVQATAEHMAHRVGLHPNAALGICYACSSAARATEIAALGRRDIEGDQYTMFVASEKLSSMNDLSSPNTGFLFGDGVGIAVLRHDARWRILHAFADQQQSDLIGMRRIPDALTVRDEARLMHCIEMNGREVFKQGTGLMMTGLSRSLYEARMRPEDIEIIIPHQANARFVDQLEKEWEKRYEATAVPPIDISIVHDGNNGAGAWIRRMAEKQADGSLDDVHGVIAAPFAGGGEFMRSGKLSYGNILLQQS